MKRRILVILSLIVIFLVAFYIGRYHSGVCLCDKIPSGVEEALVINTRSLEEQVILDVVRHPFSFFGETERDSTTDKGPSLLSAVSLPTAIVAYKSGQNFCSGVVKIKDREKLMDYISHHGYTPQDENESYFKNGERHIMLYHSSVQICFGKEKPPILEIESISYQKKGDTLFDALEASSADFTYVGSEEKSLDVDIEGNTIRIHGRYNLEALLPSAATIPDDGLGVLSARLDLDKLADLTGPDALEKFSDFTKLQTDSLFSYWDGRLSGTLSDFSMAQDTITTYEYDDDFNQVEVKEIKESIQPDFAIVMGMDSSGYNYMKRKKAVVEESGRQILAIMPLVTTYVDSGKDGLLMYTSTPSSTLDSSDYKLQARLNLENIRSEELPQVLRLLDSFDLSIDNDDQVKGELKLRGGRGVLAALMGRGL